MCDVIGVIRNINNKQQDENEAGIRVKFRVLHKALAIRDCDRCNFRLQMTCLYLNYYYFHSGKATPGVLLLETVIS